VNFYELVSHIRGLGCRVYLYDRKELKVNKCEGTFQVSKKGNPVIAIAMGAFDDDYDRLLTLMHEFCHFLQWKDGFWNDVHKESEGWDVVDKYIRYTRKKIQKEDVKKAREAVLLLEYDAEIRTLDLARCLSIDIDSENYIRDANNYILQIKWAIETKSWKFPAHHEDISSTIMTRKSLLAPLTNRDKKIMG
jgi:hypothetical protein